ncbi:unnamed protein product [Nesidiocoris tenuis]|uniref:Uncharacterized protein n=1 Tax=Nesidiocoris tenuis TaxID=355587 RepID=A0A6H5GFL3_9HEMI|nr:unnamed protein product [Nesidiocoris tenuis]
MRHLIATHCCGTTDLANAAQCCEIWFGNSLSKPPQCPTWLKCQGNKRRKRRRRRSHHSQRDAQTVCTSSQGH